MLPQRLQLAGPPHIYYVTGRCALNQPLFAQEQEAAHFLTLAAALLRCADANLFGYAIEGQAYHLIFQHREQVLDSDREILQRWRRFSGGGPGQQAGKLRARFASVGGIMQTLAQRYSRAWHQRHGGSGSIWAGRYRACLLADASGLLCAIAWLEYACAERMLLSSRGRHQPEHEPQLASLPLREHRDGSVTPADEGALLTVPPPPSRIQELIDLFADDIDDDSFQVYGHALDHGWALGRPESLIEATARLGREGGRGRSRRIRELDDVLGLCGFWG
jgi:hypothetical protein